ncbi:hypothetical protein I302_104363 [Kwoniella bestiolae CBS 10118]|uniref:Uncharacterized protein n=1 Tax=Kwoniella bestiolae CBS 10118 TaxID=1296100 RepID=A0A1B9GB14_9TREE|nr:hypothetical protein I302_03071 [Kwoniella bestiolae CBS 10118]OCF28219.1 hypothetical protein I302_03071 [Kwoniella bestiolae CBS 10118]
MNHTPPSTNAFPSTSTDQVSPPAITEVKELERPLISTDGPDLEEAEHLNDVTMIQDADEEEDEDEDEEDTLVDINTMDQTSLKELEEEMSRHVKARSKDGDGPSAQLVDVSFRPLSKEGTEVSVFARSTSSWCDGPVLNSGFIYCSEGCYSAYFARYGKEIPTCNVCEGVVGEGCKERDICENCRKRIAREKRKKRKDAKKL